MTLPTSRRERRAARRQLAALGRARRKRLGGKTVAGVVALAALGGAVMGAGLAGWPGREPSVGASNGWPQPSAFGRGARDGARRSSTVDI